MSLTLSYSAGSWPNGARKRAAVVREPGVRALLLEGLGDGRVDALVLEDLVRCPSSTKTAIGTPQARWRETTQSGRFSIMPVMRFSPDRRHPLDRLDGR